MRTTKASHLPTLLPILAALLVVQFGLPSLAASHALNFDIKVVPAPFVVSVDPVAKTIAGGSDLSPHTLDQGSLLANAAAGASTALTYLAVAAAESPLYQVVAPESAPTAVVIQPGFRREQVATAFAAALKWSPSEKKAFLNAASTTDEGTFYPSTYIVSEADSPEVVHGLVAARFAERVLSRYASSTEEQVPLKTALTIASLIEREAGSESEMRVISGVIWNRIFSNMSLQIDATLQYARGTEKNNWWPVPRAKDKYLPSLFNTYQHSGLPPAPIASPSFAAIAAALNPVNTSCLFYFHDKYGGLHCSATYAEHVSLLKKYYGRGK